MAIFKEDCLATNLDSRAVAFTFKQMTEFFTLYNIPLEYNIANRFRLGEMPLVVTDYGLYNTLNVFAPELRGQWGFTVVPGTREPSGDINRTVPITAGSWHNGQSSWYNWCNHFTRIGEKGRSMGIFKWWTSKDVQVAFGRELRA